MAIHPIKRCYKLVVLLGKKLVPELDSTKLLHEFKYVFMSVFSPTLALWLALFCVDMFLLRQSVRFQEESIRQLIASVSEAGVCFSCVGLYLDEMLETVRQKREGNIKEVGPRFLYAKIWAMMIVGLASTFVFGFIVLMLNIDHNDPTIPWQVGPNGTSGTLTIPISVIGGFTVGAACIFVSSVVAAATRFGRACIVEADARESDGDIADLSGPAEVDLNGSSQPGDGRTTDIELQ